MSEEVNKEQTKDASQEKTTELTDAQLDKAAGGLQEKVVIRKAFEDITRTFGTG